MEDEEDKEDPLTDDNQKMKWGKYVCNPHLITIAEQWAMVE